MPASVPCARVSSRTRAIRMRNTTGSAIGTISFVSRAAAVRRSASTAVASRW
jgi:hypothetical protein